MSEEHQVWTTGDTAYLRNLDRWPDRRADALAKAAAIRAFSQGSEKA